MASTRTICRLVGRRITATPRVPQGAR
jgi:hypothetical protein